MCAVRSAWDSAWWTSSARRSKTQMTSRGPSSGPRSCLEKTASNMCIQTAASGCCRAMSPTEKSAPWSPGAISISELGLRPRTAPGLLPVPAEEIGDAAVGLEELVGRLEDGEEKPALRSGPRLMAAARGAPDELAGAAFALGTLQGSFEHVGLLDLHVLMVGKPRARRHAHQGRQQSAGAVDQQRLLLDAGIAGLLPRQLLYVNKARSQLGTVHGFRC